MENGTVEQPVSTAPTAKRRWFRFSLRTLLVFVLLTGSGMGLWVGSEAWKLVRRLDDSGGCFSPDGSRIASWARHGRLRLYSITDERPLWEKETNCQDPQRAAISADNRYVALCGRDSICVLDMATGVERFALMPPAKIFFITVAFDSSSHLLTYTEFEEGPTVGEGRARIRGVNVASGKEVFCLEAHSETWACAGWISVIEFSRDGKWMATSDAQEITVWDLSSLPQHHVLCGQRIYHLRFADDSKNLMGWRIAYDGGCRVKWDIGNPQPVVGSRYDPLELCPQTPDGRFVLRYGSVFERRCPHYWWGLAWLPEFWLTMVFAAMFVWSLWRDRRDDWRAAVSAGSSGIA